MKLKSTAWLLAALMCGAAIAGVTARPTIVVPPDFLEASVPKTFGEWQEVREVKLIIDPATKELLRDIYPEMITRTYVDKSGYRIMVSIARSADQLGIRQAHLPEICYPAQGFKLLSPVAVGTLTTPYGSIDVTQLKTSLGSRSEPVTYWLTMSDEVVRSQWDKRLIQFRSIFTGQARDGLLFRISSIDRDPERAFATQQKFVADMMASVTPEARRRLSGLKPPAGAI
jgi:EpsI family protein